MSAQVSANLIDHDPQRLNQLSFDDKQLLQLANRRKVCFSFAAYAKNVIDHLRLCHIPISQGLCDAEFRDIESKFRFTFPPDLRAILHEGLPVGEGFPKWRSGSECEIRALLDLPIAALCHEITRGLFWCSEWGKQPAQLDESLQMASTALQNVPTLVPIYGTCYIACYPVLAGNPIFLIHDARIFYCGYDIADFFRRQAFIPRQSGSGVIDGELAMKNCQNSDDFVTQACSPREESPQENADAACNIPIWRWGTDSPRTPEMYRHAIKESNLVVQQPLAKCADHLMKESLKSFEATQEGMMSDQYSPKVSHVKISKYLYFYEKPLPNRMLTRFTMAAPPWAAKAARKIEFWSKIAEQMQKQIRQKGGEGLQCNCKLELHSNNWVPDYLEGLANTLRRGHWGEDDISEMLKTKDTPSQSKSFAQQKSDNYLELELGRLWDCLEKAGWSVAEITEMMSSQL